MFCHEKYSQNKALFGPALCAHNSQWANWKINFNLNYWNKELYKPEMKKKKEKRKTPSSRSPLIGKPFLQGILMVLREDCKIKLMSWWGGGRLIACGGVYGCVCVCCTDPVRFICSSTQLSISFPPFPHDRSTKWRLIQRAHTHSDIHSLTPVVTLFFFFFIPLLSEGSVGGSWVKLN